MPRRPRWPRWVALIRALNVGGHSVVPMEKLKKLFASFGATDVTTYIQSGNVVFSHRERDAAKLAQRLEAHLRGRALPKDATIFVLDAGALQDALAHDPFAGDHASGEHHVQHMFLSAAPDGERRRALMAALKDDYRFHLRDRVLYYTYAKALAGRRRTIDFERLLGVRGTSRTRNVVAKLVELARLDET